MAFEDPRVKPAIIRFSAPVGVVLLCAGILFGSSALAPNLTSFLFTSNAITIAITFAAYRARALREGIVGLTVWYLLLTVVLYAPPTAWNFLMAGCYVVVLAATTATYLGIADRSMARNRPGRFFIGSLMVGIAHAVIVLVLQLVSLRIFEHPARTFEWSYLNLRNGVLIGLFTVAGMELADYLLARPSDGAA